MIVGSKLDDVLAVSIPSKQDLADEASSTASKEPLSQQKIHRKVLDKGIPDDVMPGILDSKVIKLSKLLTNPLTWITNFIKLTDLHKNVLASCHRNHYLNFLSQVC